MEQVSETQRLRIEVYVGFHLAQFYVPNAVIDVLQSDGIRSEVWILIRLEARKKEAVVVLPLDERVDGVAVGGDGGNDDFAIIIRQDLWLSNTARAAPRRLVISTP